MSSFHLRPVSPTSASPTPPPQSNLKQSTSAPVAHPASANTMSRIRRPLSPSSLRDVDLTHVQDGELPPRKYPAPPTGHELMAMFPPAQPNIYSEMPPGPTSGFFQRQERAFFAQAGKEIVRFRLGVEVADDADSENGSTKSRARDTGASRPSTTPVHNQHFQSGSSTSPQLAATPSAPFQPQNSRQPRGSPITPATSPLFPITSHSLPQPPNPHLPSIGGRTPPQEMAAPNAKVEPQPEEYRDDPDESWKRPMPYAERRRAGKHTRRVVVRN